MSILDKLRKLFIPRPCVICDEPLGYDLKIPLCDDCLSIWDKHLDVKCVKCGKTGMNCTCVPSELKRNFPFVCWSVFYTGSKALLSPDVIVYNLKQVLSVSTIGFCAEMMRRAIISQCKAHNVSYKDFAVTFTPRSEENVCQYGFDQSRELAKEISKLLDSEFVECFENTGKKEQKKLDRFGRLQNARLSYVLKKDFQLMHKKYFLVDDVLTSGATLFVCGRLLYDVGADAVVPVTYCKDNIDKGEK